VRILLYLFDNNDIMLSISLSVESYSPMCESNVDNDVSESYPHAIMRAIRRDVCPKDDIIT